MSPKMARPARTNRGLVLVRSWLGRRPRLIVVNIGRTLSETRSGHRRKAPQASAPRRVRPSSGSSGGPQMTLTVTEAGLSLTNPAAYTDEGRLHEALTLLRPQAPAHRVEADRYDPFWGVTRHARS